MATIRGRMTEHDGSVCIGSFQIPQPLIVAGNVVENFNKFELMFKIYTNGSILWEFFEEHVKIAEFLNLIGPEGVNLYKENCLEADTLDEVLKNFRNYLEKKKAPIPSREKLFFAKQKDNETIEAYVKRLRELARTCDFRGLEEHFIKHQLMVGVRDKELQGKLLKEMHLTLQDFMRTCLAWEIEKASKKKKIKCNENIKQGDEKDPKAQQAQQTQQTQQTQQASHVVGEHLAKKGNYKTKGATVIFNSGSNAKGGSVVQKQLPHQVTTGSDVAASKKKEIKIEEPDKEKEEVSMYEIALKRKKDELIYINSKQMKVGVELERLAKELNDIKRLLFMSCINKEHRVDAGRQIIQAESAAMNKTNTQSVEVPTTSQIKSKSQKPRRQNQGQKARAEKLQRIIQKLESELEKLGK